VTAASCQCLGGFHWRDLNCALRLHVLLQVNIEVDCRFVQDMLKGDECYELRLCLKEHKDEAFPFKDDD